LYSLDFIITLLPPITILSKHPYLGSKATFKYPLVKDNKSYKDL
jgi:hypothetical protein